MFYPQSPSLSSVLVPSQFARYKAASVKCEQECEKIAADAIEMALLLYIYWNIFGESSLKEHSSLVV